MRGFAQKVQISPTAVGGCFRSSLLSMTHCELTKSHQRKLVDCSDPLFNTSFISPKYVQLRISIVHVTLCREDLKHPPTAVGGIRLFVQSNHAQFGGEFAPELKTSHSYRVNKAQVRTVMRIR